MVLGGMRAAPLVWRELERVRQSLGRRTPTSAGTLTGRLAGPAPTSVMPAGARAWPGWAVTRPPGARKSRARRRPCASLSGRGRAVRVVARTAAQLGDPGRVARFVDAAMSGQDEDGQTATKSVMAAWAQTPAKRTRLAPRSDKLARTLAVDWFFGENQ